MDRWRCKVIIGRISGKELAKLREAEGEELFDKNVRGYLKLQNQVNKEIYKTASSNESASNFFFLNNGITIVCGRVSFFNVDESPDLEIHDLQVVNGGQTTNSIFEAYRNKTLSENTYLLIRIVETLDQELLDKITEATNTQTSVKSRDLHSNDDIQRTLENILKTKGYFYEARANKYKDNPLARGKRIDMLLAAQALYAFCHKMPADAKNKKRDLTGVLYFDIFNETTNPDDLILAYKTLEYVRKMHQNFINKFTFVKYAEFHSITMLGELGVKELSDLNKQSVKKKYRDILNAIKIVVDEEIQSKGDDYSHRALFINPASIGRIKEAYVEMSKK